jgi:RIO-like serine/threonine protein kinase
MWAKREFLNLKQAYDAGVPVPKPYTVVDNVLVMGFIGGDRVRQEGVRRQRGLIANFHSSGASPENELTY